MARCRGIGRALGGEVSLMAVGWSEPIGLIVQLFEILRFMTANAYSESVIDYPRFN